MINIKAKDFENEFNSIICWLKAMESQSLNPQKQTDDTVAVSAPPTKPANRAEKLSRDDFLRAFSYTFDYKKPEYYAPSARYCGVFRDGKSLAEFFPKTPLALNTLLDTVSTLWQNLLHVPSVIYAQFYKSRTYIPWDPIDTLNAYRPAWINDMLSQHPDLLIMEEMTSFHFTRLICQLQSENFLDARTSIECITSTVSIMNRIMCDYFYSRYHNKNADALLM
ncbi:hypothetical protein [Ranid herpesvirus 3]|uniref:Uncharacterized protein n=1 Tax=Ranid herpesvirus 3 TaxID=1987509 RepID=A0A1X9T5K0_9VIRU|nr:hypothetical protein [Ranid herpesvirus 3]ARR28981.1 hypothetical protein [Ranid herpesvirus 3]